MSSLFDYVSDEPPPLLRDHRQDIIKKLLFPNAVQRWKMSEQLHAINEANRAFWDAGIWGRK